MLCGALKLCLKLLIQKIFSNISGTSSVLSACLFTTGSLSRLANEADMKTPLIAIIALLASTPAGASIDTSEATSPDIAPQPAAYQSEPAPQPESKCGEPRQMMFILRDQSGAVVAMGIAEVPTTC
jgi:hypothetical protein